MLVRNSLEALYYRPLFRGSETNQYKGGKEHTCRKITAGSRLAQCEGGYRYCRAHQGVRALNTLRSDIFRGIVQLTPHPYCNHGAKTRNNKTSCLGPSGSNTF